MSALQDAIEALLRSDVGRRAGHRARLALQEDPERSLPLLFEALEGERRRAHRLSLMVIIHAACARRPDLSAAHALALAAYMADPQLAAYALSALQHVPGPWPPALQERVLLSLAENPRELAFRLTERGGGPWDAGELAPLLSSPHPLARVLALQSLTRQRDPRAPALLREAAQDPAPQVRSVAWWGLSRLLRDERVSLDWVRSHPEPDPRLRAAWLRALGHACAGRRDDWAEAQLRAGLRAPEVPLLTTALTHLNALGAVEVTEDERGALLAAWRRSLRAASASNPKPLLGALGDEDPRVRVLALHGLAQRLKPRLGPSARRRQLPIGRAARPLMLEDPCPEVRYQAWRVWRRSGLALEERPRGLGWCRNATWPMDCVQRAATVLCGGPPEVDALAHHLRSTSSRRRAMATKLLVHPTPPSPARAALLAAAARDPSRRVRVLVPPGR